jgi:hypothetical protein
MIRKDDLQLILQKRPFTPFRIHFSNGASHDVTHPDTILLSERVAAVAVGDSLWFFSIGHVVQLEPPASVHA